MGSKDNIERFTVQPIQAGDCSQLSPEFGRVPDVQKLFGVISPWSHRVSLTDSFNISVWSGFSGDTLGRLVFFNDAKYGPYRGSIMALGGPGSREVRRGWHTADDDYDFGVITFTNTNGTIDRLRLCDLPGVYFRHFHFHDQARTLWTLMISLWYPLILFSILPAAWIFRWQRSRHRSHAA